MKALLIALALSTSTVATAQQQTFDEYMEMLNSRPRVEPAEDDRLCLTANNVETITQAELDLCEARRNVFLTNRTYEAYRASLMMPTIVEPTPDRPVLSRLLRSDTDTQRNWRIYNEVRPLLTATEHGWLYRYLHRNQTIATAIITSGGGPAVLRISGCDHEWSNARLVRQVGQPPRLAEPATIAQAITVGSAIAACEHNNPPADSCDILCQANGSLSRARIRAGAVTGYRP